MNSKTCCRCKEEKPFTDFSIVNKNKDGRRGMCKECVNEKYNWRNREKTIGFEIPLWKPTGELR